MTSLPLSLNSLLSQEGDWTLSHELRLQIKSQYLYRNDVFVTHLFADRPRHGDREGADVATAQVLSFALVTKKLQLSLLFIVQTVTVAHLDTPHTEITVKLSFELFGQTLAILFHPL